MKTTNGLVGGFKYFLFSPLFGEDFQFDQYFSNGLKPPTSFDHVSTSFCSFFCCGSGVKDFCFGGAVFFLSKPVFFRTWRLQQISDLKTGLQS